MGTVQQQGRGVWDWQLVQVVLSISALYFLQLFFFGGFDEATNRQAIRMSARISGVLFSLAFMASAFHHFVKNSFSWWLRMNRRYLGISFAIMHLVHLGFLILLQLNFHPVFFKAKTISILGGGLAYFFAVTMLLTSFPFFAKYLSKKKWTILHIIGGYWIWYIFIRSYVKRLTTEIEYLPLVILFVAVFLLRFFYYFKKRV
ncbi:MAG: hypothetical protein AAFZ15_26695 [Bacteroidota bacterium]